MRVRKGILRLFGAGALFSLISIAVSGEEICPAKLGGGEVKDGQYQFQFKSWGWPKDARYVFCNCVRNDGKDLPIFVDWQRTNLSGFVEAGAEIHVYDDYSSDAHDEKKMSLFYGAGLKRIDALTMIPTEPRRSRIDRNVSFAQIAETPKYDATQDDNTGARETRTQGKIFIPLIFGAPAGDKSAIIQEVESGKWPVIPVYMEFSSKASKVGDKIRLDFICRYRVNLFGLPRVIEARAPVAAISADPKLKEMFGDALPFVMTGDWSVHQDAVAFGNSVEVPSGSNLTLQRGVMTFASPNGVVLGSIPVNYLTPR